MTRLTTTQQQSSPLTLAGQQVGRSYPSIPKASRRQTLLYWTTYSFISMAKWIAVADVVISEPAFTQVYQLMVNSVASMIWLSFVTPGRLLPWLLKTST